MRAEELSLIGRWSGVTARAVDFWIQKVSPTWSNTLCLASIVAIDEECPGVKTITLRPNHRWIGAKAGQHVPVSVEVDGRWMQRSWTVSSSADHSLVRLTIGRIEDGCVTSWIHDHMQVGDIVKLGPARGEFVLPADGRPVVFFAGGTGVTPALSMLRTMRDRQDHRAFTLLYFVRSEAHIIAQEELQVLQEQLPHVRIEIIATDGHSDASPRLIHDAQVRDFQLSAYALEAEWMLCGPEGFMDATTRVIDTIHPEVSLKREHFTPVRITSAGAGGTVQFALSDKEGANKGTQTLLEAAEDAGLQPKFGCRAGICFECSCIKREGAVVDLRTGEILRETNQQIQLCITQAVGDVIIDL